MAAITWAVSGGRVVEIVGDQMRVTDIPVADYESGKLPYGQVFGEPFSYVPHQDSPTNFDQSTRIVPWLEDIYRGDPLPGMQPVGSVTVSRENNTLDPAAGGTLPGIPLLGTLGQYLNNPTGTTSGVGVNTGTGAPKPLAVVGPPDVFIGGSLGEIRVVGPGPLVGESSGIRMGILPRIVLRDQLGEGI